MVKVPLSVTAKEEVSGLSETVTVLPLESSAVNSRAVFKVPVAELSKEPLSSMILVALSATEMLNEEKVAPVDVKSLVVPT